MQQLVAHADRPAAGITAGDGLGGAFLGASAVFGELQNALDRIWRAPAAKQQSGWMNILRSRLLSFGMILAVAFVLMVSLVLSAVRRSASGGRLILPRASRSPRSYSRSSTRSSRAYASAGATCGWALL